MTKEHTEKYMCTLMCIIFLCVELLKITLSARTSRPIMHAVSNMQFESNNLFQQQQYQSFNGRQGIYVTSVIVQYSMALNPTQQTYLSALPIVSQFISGLFLCWPHNLDTSLESTNLKIPCSLLVHLITLGHVSVFCNKSKRNSHRQVV